MPLIGSSGSISPSSIFVNIILAKRPNTSSTFSPLKADTSTDTGTLLEDAQFEASEEETSRPSGATVARSCVPRPRDVDAGILVDEAVEGTEPTPGVRGK